MPNADFRSVGRTSLRVSTLGFGAAPIGNSPGPLADEQCQAAVVGAFESGMRYFDTSPAYGGGLSEHLLGRGLRAVERKGFVLSTKVGRYLVPKPDSEVLRSSRALRMSAVVDYSYDAAMRSVDQSYQRLGLNSIDILHIHDVDVKTHGSADAYEQRFREAMDGAYVALEKLRADGTIKAIGIGVHDIEPCLRFLNAGDFDCILLSGHYTLLEQGAKAELLPLCARKGASLLVAGPFASGILATGSIAGATYKYQAAPPDILARVRQIEEICRSFSVALPAAAIQFPLAHPSVSSVVTGAISPEEVHANASHMRAAIPAGFWQALKDEKLLDDDAATPVTLSSGTTE